MIKTGYNELDKLIQLNKGNLIAIASRPKNGKTTLKIIEELTAIIKKEV